jgi:XTP/dITP diphosphohydrolase
MSQPRLLIASNNAGKIAEFRDLLRDCGWRIVSPTDVGLEIEVQETGESYADNARLKAEAFCRASGLAALADDSGLEVDALGGEPGPLHHLRGWDGRDQVERIAILLNALRDTQERQARFRAVVVVALADGRVLEEDGVCEGVIATSPAGDGGFGYDPVFLLPERGMTMAQLTPAEKNRVSHRAAAARKISARLRELASTLDAET